MLNPALNTLNPIKPWLDNLGNHALIKQYMRGLLFSLYCKSIYNHFAPSMSTLHHSGLLWAGVKTEDAPCTTRERCVRLSHCGCSDLIFEMPHPLTQIKMLFWFWQISIILSWKHQWCHWMMLLYRLSRALPKTKFRIFWWQWPELFLHEYMICSKDTFPATPEALPKENISCLSL